MPKARPISLHPLSFDEALDVLLNTPPETKAKKAPPARRGDTPKRKRRGKGPSRG